MTKGRNHDANRLTFAKSSRVQTQQQSENDYTTPVSQNRYASKQIPIKSNASNTHSAGFF